MEVWYVFFGLIALWLILLTGFIFWFFRKINPVVKEAKGEPFLRVLEKLVDLEKKNTTGVEDLRKKLDEFKKEGLLHIQKIGIVRFNPFNETGGDHSFSLAALDALGSGFVITGLHSRERTRLYTKLIVEGKSSYELSKEELQAIKKAGKGEQVKK